MYKHLLHFPPTDLLEEEFGKMSDLYGAGSCNDSKSRLNQVVREKGLVVHMNYVGDVQMKIQPQRSSMQLICW